MPIATLRPNAAGDLTDIANQYPSSGEHWDKVDEVTSDEDDTFVWQAGLTAKDDLYNLPSLPGGVGAISNVRITIRARKTGAGSFFAAQSLKTNGVLYNGDGANLTTSYANYSDDWATNPQSGVAWTVTEVNALQAGVYISHISGLDYGQCTQVWVEVTYSDFIPKVFIM